MLLDGIFLGRLLMLALAERLAADEGISWAYCDTDSMALSRPEAMSQDVFLAAAKRVQAWFNPLNPYDFSADVFKIEEANRPIGTGPTTSELKPLYCYAISAKRYVLFNLDSNGRPALRKASAHGLGHLVAPYGNEDTPRGIPEPLVAQKDLGVKRWQHDLWYRIVEAALEGHPDQVQLDDLPGLDKLAAGRYAATTTKMLDWFDTYNEG